MSSLSVSSTNGIKVYNLTSGKTLPEWLKDKSKKGLKFNEDFRSRIEIVQHFEFPEASNRMKLSRDGNYLLATGTYAPRVHCYDLRELTLKFDRHIDHDVTQFQVLSNDWEKMVFLRADRYLEFHARYGRHYTTRIPSFGRDMAYYEPNCDLYITSMRNEVYRLNLEEGKHYSPLILGSEGANVVGLNPLNHLLAFGCEDGVVECWDPRAPSRVSRLNASPLIANTIGSSVAPVGGEITALRFDQSDGLSMAVGTHSGHVAVFDIRSAKPMSIRDHQYSLPIVDIKFQPSAEKGTILSSDSRVMKIWNYRKIVDENMAGTLLASIEPPHPINDACVVPNSGMVMFAVDAPRMQMYYVPALGPAPRWCSYLDTITEELEEKKSTQGAVYEDYKFVTRDELATLGLTHLVGTKVLRAYMHGFFMDYRLYQKAHSILQPFAYEEYRKQRIQEKVREELDNRITIKRKAPKVNKDLAERMEDAKASKKTNVLQDNRFSKLFENPDFQVDEHNEEFRRLNPHGKKSSKKRPFEEEDEMDDDVAARGFEALQDDMSDPSERDSDSDADSGSDNENDNSEEARKKAERERKSAIRSSIRNNTAPAPADTTDHKKAGGKKNVKMYAGDDILAGEDAWVAALSQGKEAKKKVKTVTKVPLADRIKDLQEIERVEKASETAISFVKGTRQMQFVVDSKGNIPKPKQENSKNSKGKGSSKKAKYANSDDDDEDDMGNEEIAAHKRRDRRGVQALGLKDPVARTWKPRK